MASISLQQNVSCLFEDLCFFPNMSNFLILSPGQQQESSTSIDVEGAGKSFQNPAYSAEDGTQDSPAAPMAVATTVTSGPANVCLVLLSSGRKCLMLFS